MSELPYSRLVGFQFRCGAFLCPVCKDKLCLAGEYYPELAKEALGTEDLGYIKPLHLPTERGDPEPYDGLAFCDVCGKKLE